MDILSEALKAKKMRWTQARADIYSCLKKQSKALSAREVFAKLPKKSNTDLVSVYRNLTLFEDLGLAHKFQNGRYAICGHDHSLHVDHNHIHIINHCIECGENEELHKHSKDLCELANQLTARAKTLKAVQEIVLQGICKNCR